MGVSPNPPVLLISHADAVPGDDALAHRLIDGLQAPDVTLHVLREHAPIATWDASAVTPLLESSTHVLVLLSGDSLRYSPFLDEIRLVIRRQRDDLDFNILLLPVGAREGDFPRIDVLSLRQWIPYHETLDLQVQAIRQTLGLVSDGVDSPPTDNDDLSQQLVSFIEHTFEREVLQAWIADSGIVQETFIDLLVEKSQGSPLYLHHIVQELEAGTYRSAQLDQLPVGLDVYYYDHWVRMEMTTTPSPTIPIRLIYLLSEVRLPVSPMLLHQFATTDHLSIDAQTVEKFLAEWDLFLHKQIAEDGLRYSIHHPRYRQFLHREDILTGAGVTLQAIHSLIAHNLWEELFTNESD